MACVVAVATAGCGLHIGYMFTGRASGTYSMPSLVAGTYEVGIRVDADCSQGVTMVLRQTQGGNAVVPLVSEYVNGQLRESPQLPSAGTYDLEVTDTGRCGWFFALSFAETSTP